MTMKLSKRKKNVNNFAADFFLLSFVIFPKKFKQTKFWNGISRRKKALEKIIFYL